MGMKTKRHSKRVDFSHVEIHEFKQVIGDSPSVRKGVPVALGPELEKMSVVEIDFYEHYRGTTRPVRELALGEKDRMEILLSAGFKGREIADAIRKSRRSRHDREHSYYNRSWDNFHEKLEVTSRTMKKVVGLHQSGRATKHPAFEMEAN